MLTQMCLTCKPPPFSFLRTFERFTSGCVHVCVCSFESLWISFSLLRQSSPLSELGTWHDNWRPCNLCLKCQRYLCQHDFVWTRRHTGEGPPSLFKPYACVCSGILGGLSIVTMAIYLRRARPHPLQLLPWPYAWSFFFFLKGFHCSLILLVPGNSDTSLPKAKLRGNALPKKSHGILTALARSWLRRGNVMFH